MDGEKRKKMVMTCYKFQQPGVETRREERERRRILWMVKYINWKKPAQDKTWVEREREREKEL